MVEKVSLVQVVFQVHLFSFNRIISAVLHTHSLLCHQYHIMLVFDSVIKCHLVFHAQHFRGLHCIYEIQQNINTTLIG